MVVMIQANDWPKVRAALANPKWDFRTVEGVARETGLDAGSVERLIEQHRSEVRQTWSRERRVIYTLRSRAKELREILADVQMFVSKSF